METYVTESLMPYEDETIPDTPSTHGMNIMFKLVTGGLKKGQMYGCGTMTFTIYPEDMSSR